VPAIARKPAVFGEELAVQPIARLRDPRTIDKNDASTTRVILLLESEQKVMKSCIQRGDESAAEQRALLLVQ